MSAMGWVVLAAFGLGLLLGSFLNVCIARLPWGESIVRPGSRCPQCRGAIRWFENVPVVSFLALRGRCRGCEKKISWQYPLVELLVGCWFAYVARVTFGGDISDVPFLMEMFAVAAAGWLLIGVMFTDWQAQVVPDGFTYSGMLLGFLLVCSEAIFLPSGADDIHLKRKLRMGAPGAMVERGDVFLTGPEHMVYGRLAAIVGAALLLLVIRWAYKAVRGREGLGLGDVKLLAMIAALLGWWPAVLALFVGVVLCSAYATVLLMRGRASSTTRLPLGSFLAVGGLVAASVGPMVLNWYAGLMR